MGVGIRVSSCNERVVIPVPGNPNPRKFRIVRVQAVNGFTLAEVHYPDCSNYEGRKILVFAGVSPAKVRALTSIDPHFCDDAAHASPVARFEPTLRGWEFALAFAKSTKPS